MSPVVGWGVCIFAELPDDADGAGLRITRFEETTNSERAHPVSAF